MYSVLLLVLPSSAGNARMYAHRSPHDSLFDAYARRHVASSIHRFSSGVPCVFLVTLGVLTGIGYSCGPGVGALPGKNSGRKRVRNTSLNATCQGTNCDALFC